MAENGLGLGPALDDDVASMLSDSASSFLAARHDRSKRVRGLRGDPEGMDRTIWCEMAELGWLSLCVPEDRGGADLKPAHAGVLARLFGAALLNEPFVAAGLLPTGILWRLPRTDDGDALLAEAISGKRIIGAAWQEAAGQLDFDTARCALHSPVGSTKANGVKRFIPWGAAADTLLVTGQRDGVFTVASIDTDHPAISIARSVSIDGNPDADVSLHDAPVTILATGEPAARAMRDAGLEATAALAAELVGLSSAALAITADYLRVRVQFGKPIGSFQALQHRMADYYNQVRLADASVAAAAAALSNSPESAGIAVSAAKARAADTAHMVTAGAIQLHGAIGYTDEHDIGLYLKGALRRAAWLGTAKRHRDRALTLMRPLQQGRAA